MAPGRSRREKDSPREAHSLYLTHLSFTCSSSTLLCIESKHISFTIDIKMSMLASPLKRSVLGHAAAGPSRLAAAAASSARGFATSSPALLATPAEGKPQQLKDFKIYRWVSSPGHLALVAERAFIASNEVADCLRLPFLRALTTPPRSRGFRHTSST